MDKIVTADYVPGPIKLAMCLGVYWIANTAERLTKSICDNEVSAERISS